MKKSFVFGLITIIGIIALFFVPKRTQEQNNVQNNPKISPILSFTPKPVVRENIIVSPTQSLSPKPAIVKAKNVLFDVPFIVQAPHHNWKDPVYQNACEEASILMAMRWVQGRNLTNEEAFIEIQKISNYSKAHYGFYLDQSAEDLAKLMRDYFKYSNVRFQANINTDDIKAELYAGNLVLIPVNGQKLGNPYFTQPGPTEHMLLVKGYDAQTKEFITNDSGIGKGNGYRYKEAVIDGAMRMYPSGYKEKIDKIEKVMIVVGRQISN